MDYLFKENIKVKESINNYLKELGNNCFEDVIRIYADTNNYLLGDIINKHLIANDESEKSDTDIFIFDLKENDFYIFEFYPNWEGRLSLLSQLKRVFKIYKINANHDLEYVLRINIFESNDYIITEYIKIGEKHYCRSVREESQIDLNLILTDYTFVNLIPLINKLASQKVECESWEETDFTENNWIAKYLK